MFVLNFISMNPEMEADYDKNEKNIAPSFVWANHCIM